MSAEKKYHDMIDAAFLGQLSGTAWQELKAHLATCNDCRARYNRATRAERTLAGGPGAVGTPSPAELSRVEASVFAALGDETKVTLLDRLRSWLVAPPKVALASLAAAAAILAVIFVPRQPEPDELQARGGVPGERPAIVRAFCIQTSGVTPLEQQAQCSLTSQLRLAVGNPGGYRYAFLVGVQSDRAPRWYAPKPPEKTSAEAPAPNEGEVPFGSAVRLEVNHEVGPLRVFALFSDQPILANEVEAAIAELSKRAGSIAGAEVLPLARKDVAQRSVLLQVSP